MCVCENMYAKMYADLDPNEEPHDEKLGLRFCLRFKPRTVETSNLATKETVNSIKICMCIYI